MATFMWTVWIVGTLLSLLTIYAMLRVLYGEDVEQVRVEESGDG